MRLVARIVSPLTRRKYVPDASPLEVGGLLIPRVIAAYRWDNEADTLGTRRGQATFSNVSFSEEAPRGTDLNVQSAQALTVPNADHFCVKISCNSDLGLARSASTRIFRS
jgi:hypothetical protein